MFCLAAFIHLVYIKSHHSLDRAWLQFQRGAALCWSWRRSAGALYVPCMVIVSALLAYLQPFSVGVQHLPRSTAAVSLISTAHADGSVSCVDYAATHLQHTTHPIGEASLTGLSTDTHSLISRDTLHGVSPTPGGIAVDSLSASDSCTSSSSDGTDLISAVPRDGPGELLDTLYDELRTRVFMDTILCTALVLSLQLFFAHDGSDLISVGLC